MFKQISRKTVLLFREQNFERVETLSTSLTKKDPRAGRTQEDLFRFSMFDQTKNHRLESNSFPFRVSAEEITELGKEPNGSDDDRRHSDGHSIF